MSEGDTIPLRGSADMWRSRAKAAEAENQRLQAEVARLREAWEKRGEHMQNWERDYFRVCKERDAALAESNNLIVKVQFAEAVIRDKKQIERTATEAALRYVQKRWPHFYLNESDIRGAIKALLGEDEHA